MNFHGIEQEEHPTLDAIIHTLTTLTTRLDMFFSPVTSLSLTSRDLSRLFFTTLFLSPLYIIVTFYFLPPRLVLLIAGVFVLTYHSLPARVTRTILWRSRMVRLLVFYLTGLDFSRRKRPLPSRTPSNNAAAAAMAAAAKQHRSNSSGSGEGENVSDIPPSAAQSYSTSLAQDVADGLHHRNGVASSGPVVFSYVVYENQRKWLGIGWTANLLAYERTAWTDEFLNDCPSADEFTLPDAEGTGMRWKWVDPQWKIDKENGDDEGWLYYDNTWKKPSKEDAFGKYTRRRRWIRCAELVEDDELLAAEVEVANHPPLEGDIEDYKPELDRDSQSVSSDDDSVEETGSSDKTDVSVAQSASASTLVLPNRVESAEEPSLHATMHDTWSSIKKRTLLRQNEREIKNNVE